MEIPKPLRKRFGKSRFIQSLETESKSVAETRKLPVLTSWRQEIAQAKNEPVDDDAAYWRRRLRYARSDEHRAAIMEGIEGAAWEIGATNVDQVGQAPSSDPEAREFYARATGLSVAFDEHVEEWLSSTQLTAKTIDMHRSAVMRFAGEFSMVSDVRRPAVRRWVTKQINDVGLTPKTMQRILSGLRSYWRYLQSIEVADDEAEPFNRLDIARQVRRTSPQTARQAFEPSEVLQLLEAATDGDDDLLADLIRLGMWTGCRIEELCSLRVDDVTKSSLSIKDAKTSAGWRDIPIHPNLKKTINRLITDSADGYVLSGLTENKYGDRSNGIGKRFGRLKLEQGFGRQHVFHSIRKTVVTILENAGVPENVVAEIVGHEKSTMTFGLYSGGISLEVKRKALSNLTYSMEST